ncbi:EF hand domain-containing protein [Ascosphaera apis ARSEF 7405]|uniref:EF hand domain-containing protein n=1 Tax=Ascosphaera apis ARSEF 7405 TaxID=392613 RepID=A0A168C7D0_9EURO|nr:EF hand domain-containing protein [Ascosphaera apis ARSEF 7405]
MPLKLFAGSDDSRLWIQPLLLMVTGAAAAYALMAVHSHYHSSQQKGRPTLRRRNAVRRNNRSQRHRSATPGGPLADAAASIQALERMEQNGGAYGIWQVYLHSGGTLTGNLIPHDVVMPERIMRLSYPEEEVTAITQILQRAFIENFLLTEIPPDHRIDTGDEIESIIHGLLMRELCPRLIISCIRNFNGSTSFRRSIIARRAAGLGTAHMSVRVSLPFEYGSEFTYMQDPNRFQQIGAPETPSAQPLTPDSVPAQDELPAESPMLQPSSPNQPATQPLPDDQRSEFSFREDLEGDQPGREGQNLLNLLYHIADDQSRKDGYVHRGVTCNSCSVMPIQGIRYRCANCVDFDLCETCEALQVHNRTHIFYKIRVPAPFLGNPRQVQPVIYPGKPDALPRNLSRNLSKRLLAESGYESSELEALWDQFRCLADTEWPEDPNKLGLAINRKTFDKCFVPNLSSGPPTPSLIYDRMFAYYDTNDDGLIGFEEFLKGLASLTNQGRNERLKRTFDCYDLDRDGYIERKDILRVFRAYYVLTRELTRETVTSFEEDYYDSSLRDLVMNPVDRARVGYATLVRLDSRDAVQMDVTHRQRVQERWERRQFYTDEEDGSRPPLGWEQDDDGSGHDDSQSIRLPPSPRSRSSSKVRFQDDVTDNEYDTYDTRSNASSRSIPVAERWGGFEIPEAERDVGKEVLYQVTQEGINELLNALFKSKEDLMMEIIRTRSLRREYAKEINRYIDRLPEQNPLKSDGRSIVEVAEDHTESGRQSSASSQIEVMAPEPDEDSDASVTESRSAEQHLSHELALPFLHASGSAGTYPCPDSVLRTEPELDPTLPQNRPDTPDIGADLASTLTNMEADWEVSIGRPRLTHQNAEGSLSAGRLLTPEQTIEQEMPFSQPSPSGVPVTSSELCPSHSEYTDLEFTAPIGPTLSQAFEESPRPSHRMPISPTSLNTGTLSTFEEPSLKRDMLHDETPEGIKSPPPPAYLERMAKLNQAEREAERRGGNAAKLSFKEFSAKMQGEKYLEFLAHWIDVTSF